MKSVITHAFPALLAATALLCGCSRRPDGTPATPAEKAYAPLVGTNTFAIWFEDYAKAQASPAVRTLADLAERKGRELNEILTAEAGTEIDARLRKYSEMSRAEATRHFFGMEPGDLKWDVGAVEKFNPSCLLELGDGCPTNIVLPHVYEVCHAARPFDLDKTAQAVRDLWQALVAHCAADTNAAAQVSEQCALLSKVFACERLELDGAPAYRLAVSNPETGEKIAGLSPIVTTLGGGRLLVLAASEETFAHVKALYAGEEPAAPPESAIMHELALPDNVLARFAVTGIDELATALEKAADADDTDDDDTDDDDADDTDADDVSADVFDADDIRLFRLDAGVDAAATNFFLRAAVTFAEAEDAATLAKQAQDGFAVALPMAQLALAAQPELAFVGQILQTLQIASSGDTLAAGFSIPYAVIEGLDPRALARKVLEARANAPKLPFGASDDDDDVDDDGVFDDDDHWGRTTRFT